jgi:hypothetical protein
MVRFRDDVIFFIYDYDLDYVFIVTCKVVYTVLAYVIVISSLNFLLVYQGDSLRSLLHATFIETYIYDSVVKPLNLNLPADLSPMSKHRKIGQLARMLYVPTQVLPG